MWFIAEIFTESIKSKWGLIDSLCRISESRKRSYKDLLGMNDEAIEKFRTCCLRTQSVDTWGEIRLKRANFCNNTDICIACASRRAYNITKKLLERIPESWFKSKKRYMITLTMQHDEKRSLEWLLKVMFDARAKLTKAAKNSEDQRQRRKTFYSLFDGLIFSLEITKWSSWRHPHFHVLACCDKSTEIIIEGLKVKWMQKEVPSANYQWLIERNKYVKEAYEKYVDNALDVMNKSVQAFMSTKSIKSANEKEKEGMMEKVSTVLPICWLHIKTIAEKSMQEVVFWRKALGEAFKYTLKMNADRKERNLSCDDIVEAAYVLNKLSSLRLLKSWCFRWLEKAPKVREYVPIGKYISHVYSKEDGKYELSLD